MIKLNNKQIFPTIFPDKTSQIWKIENIDILKEFNIYWEFENESEIIHLSQLANLGNAYGYEMKLFIKYLPYARQDKFISNNVTFALKTFADILNQLHFKEVTIFDPHSTMATSLIRNSKAIYPIGDIRKIVNKENIDCICYPDKGAYSKYLDIYKHIDPIFEKPIIGSKVRDQKTGWITKYELSGNYKNKNVLIIDDICDGGMTFNILSKSMTEDKENCPKSINLFVTHGLFSKGLSELKKNIDKIFIPGYKIEEYGNRFIYKSY